MCFLQSIQEEKKLLLIYLCTQIVELLLKTNHVLYFFTQVNGLKNYDHKIQIRKEFIITKLK